MTKPDPFYRFLNPNLFPLEDGKYIVHSTVDSRYVWDVDVNSSNLHLWERHGGANQQFIFKANGVGFYTIKCVQTGKFVDCAGSNKDNGANVWTYDYNGTNAQIWSIRSEGNGMYSFKCIVDDSRNPRCIDLTNSRAQNGTNIWLYSANGTNAQKWTVERV